MKQFIFAGLVILGSHSIAWAVPVTLNGQYNIGGGVNILDSNGDFFEDSFVIDGTISPIPPLDTVSVLSPAGSAASAFAAASTGSLLVATDSLGASEFATAVANASFSGDFTGLGKAMRLSLDILHDASASGQDSLSQGLLSFALTGGGHVLFNEDWVFGPGDGDQALIRDFFLPAGVFGLLDISLSSLSGAFNGSATDFTSVAFTLNTVPEPLTLFSMLLGLAGLALMRRRGWTLAYARG